MARKSYGGLLGMMGVTYNDTQKSGSLRVVNMATPWYISAGKSALGFALKVGGAVAAPLLGYKYLTESGLIEEGARQFGTGYGTGLPHAYLAAQEETMPILKELERIEYQRQAPYYQQGAYDYSYAQEAARQQARLDYSTSSSSVTVKTTDIKMPYRVIIK